ncbi:MAG: shikimate kinase [Oscillospiraceae bacterium]
MIKIAYGLLGEHLAHSFSPEIHRFFGGYEYKIFEIDENNLKEFLKGSEWEGLNVTIPYKKTVIKHLDKVSKNAFDIGSVNTIIKNANGEKIGYNTDFDGFSYLLSANNIDVENKKILVLGSGGASLAVKAVLNSKKASEVITISRTGENNYENLERNFDADIIVNTTPVGMFPNNLKSPIDLVGFKKLSAVIDIIYNPLNTQLLLDAKKRNIKTANGLSMLVAQAKSASELFQSKKIKDEKTAYCLNELSKKLRNIILIGMPGCGKTSVGNALSKKLSRSIIDLDEEIVKNEKISIPEIFSQIGEDGFRKKEIEAAKEFGKRSGIILSTGGGIVLNEENYNSLHQNGIVIFINRDVNVLPTKGRPLSENTDLNLMYKTRLPLYKAFADIEIDGNDEISNVADKIIKVIKEW